MVIVAALLAESDLTKASVLPILPYPVADTDGCCDWNGDGEEDAKSTNAVLLLKFVFLSRARLRLADVFEFLSALASCEWDATVT